MKAYKLLLLIPVFLLSVNTIYSQPNWYGTTPYVSTTTTYTITVKYGIDMVGTVYFAVFNTNPTSSYSSTDIITLSGLSVPNGNLVANGVANVTAGNINSELSITFTVFDPNTLHAIYLVANGTPGGLQAVPIKLLTTTQPCPDITPATNLVNTSKCVNIGAKYTYQFFSSDGILAGATWTIDWGNLSPNWTFTSTVDGQLPSPFPSYTYPTHDSCYYNVTLKISNSGACATTGGLKKTEVAKLAGRDWAPDGNGSQLVVNAANGLPDTIRVCEGYAAFITLRDDGIWDCDQTFKAYPPGEINSPDRNVQYVFGMHPVTQAVENTITPDVLIGATAQFGAGTAKSTGPGFGTNVYTIPTATMNPITNPHLSSGVITIPATATVGQYMNVYFKNWNKCNPWTGAATTWNGSAVWDQIVILIVPSPPLPAVLDLDVCEGATAIQRTFVVTSTPVGPLNWYGQDPLLFPATPVLGTGTTFVGNTAPGTSKDYWVRDMGAAINGVTCLSQPKKVTLIVRNGIAGNTIGLTPQTICTGNAPAGLTGPVPTGGNLVYAYQWRISTTSALAGFADIPAAVGQNYNPPALAVNTWYRRQVTSGACVDDGNAVVINVTPNNTAGAASSSPNLCINTLMTNITHATTGATGIGAAVGLPAGVSAAWAANVITISGTPTASGTFNYTIPLTGGCGTVNATGTITVRPNNTAGAASSSPNLCISTLMTNITHATTGATGIGAAVGLPAGVSAAWAANVITISGTPTASGTFNYTIPLTGGCSAVNATGTITVRPNNTAGAASSSPNLCINTLMTNVTHATTGATGIGAAVGLPAGVSAAWAANVITISGTPTASGTFNYTIPLTGGCGAVNATGTITVRANNTAGAPSSTPTLCINTVLTNITHATTGATGIGAAVGLPAGVSAAWAANVITISGTPTASGTFNYTIPLTGGCSAVNATGTITVTPANTAGAASSSPNLCISTLMTNITHATTGATGIGAAVGLPAGVSAAWAANVITISGTPTASGTFNYTIPLIGGCGSVNATGTITVRPNNTAGAPSSNPTLCINTALTNITIATTGATGIGAAVGLPAGVSAAWAANVITISGTPTASGTFNYSIPMTGGCGAVNATGTITVQANNTAGAPSSTPTLCINTALTNITHATTGATGIGAAVGLPAGVSAAWAANVITISGTPTAAGTFNYTIPLTGGCGAVNAAGTITVSQNATANAGPAMLAICQGGTSAALGGSIGGQAVSGTWSSPQGGTFLPSANNLNATWTPPGAYTGTATLTLTPAGGTCAAVPASKTIQVNAGAPAQPTISGPTPVCQAVTGQVYSAPVDAAATSYIWNFAPALNVSFPGGTTSRTITVDFSPTSVTGTVTVIASNGCGNSPASAAFTITVTPTNTAGAASSTPTLCINTALTNITHATTGATGIGAAVGLPAGVSAAWAANVITISGTPTASGTFNYTIPLTGGCGSINATGTITVNPNNTVGAASSSPNLCISTVMTNITHATTGATGIGAAVGLPAGVSAAWAANVITISGTPTASGTFNYTIPLTGGCGAFNATGTITVRPNNTAGAPSSTPTLCINTALTNITHATTSATGIGAAVGLPAGVSAVWAANVITISGTPTASGTFNYTIPLTGGCGAVNATGTITVTPANTAGAASSSPNLCINTLMTNITHATTGATGIGAAVGLPAGVSAAWAANVITISGTPTASGTFNYTIPLTGGCGSVNATGTITVRPDNTAGAASSSPNLCINTLMTNITHATTGATGIGAAVGLPAGVSAAWAANVITISGTPTASGTFNYTIPLTGGCGAVNATGTITVRPNNTAGAPSSTPTLCINTLLTNITHATTGATGIGAAVGLPAGVSAAWAANVITISGTPTASGTFNYTIPLTGGCAAVNATGTITVTPNNTAGAASSSPNLCISTLMTNITHATTGATGIGAAVGLPAGVSAAWAANVITISGTPTASGTFNYTIPLTGGCGAVNATGTITVRPNNTAGAPSSTPTLCINTALTNITHATTGATGIGAAVGLPAGVSAAWAANVITISGTPTASGTFNYTIPLTGGCGAINATGTITVNPTNTAGAPSSTPTLCISTLLTNITHATTGATGIGAAVGLPAGVSAAWAANVITISGTPTASGTFNYTIPLTGGCGAVNATGTITVTPNNTAGAASSSPNLCINTLMTNITHATTGATGIGAPVGLPAGVTAAWAANVITISGTPTASGTFNYTIPLTGGCGAINATGTITVRPNNTAGAPSSTPTLCVNTALTNITHATTGATGIGAAVGLPAGVSANWAANVITISGTPTAPGTFNYTIPLTGGCGAVNATGTITVILNNTVGAPSSTPTLCINTALTNITHATTGATGIGAAVGLPAGVSAAWAANVITISGTPTATGTFNYTIPLTGGCGSFNATGTITVTPNAAITRSSPVGTDAQTPCISTAIANIQYLVTGGGTGAGVVGLPAGVTGAYAAGVFTISGTPTAAGTFNYTVTTTGTCVQAVANGSIVVSPAGQVDQPADVAYCNTNTTTAIAFTTTNVVGVTTYSWTNSAPGIGLAANGTGNIPVFTATNGGPTPVVATIVVTPTLTNGPAICVGTTKTFTITVNPTPILSTSLTPPDVCSNTVFSYVPNSATPTTTFNWTRLNTPGITPAGPISGTGNPNETLRNLTSLPIAVTYQYTLAANGCSNVQSVIVNIKPEPIPQPISGRDKICVNETNVVYSVNPVGGSTFHWNVDLAVGNKTFDFNTNAIIIKAAAGAGTGNITVYETNSYLCNGDVTTKVVDVYAQATPEIINGLGTVCQNSTHTYSVTFRAGSTYNWTVPGGAGIITNPALYTIDVLFGNVGGAIQVTETNAAGCVTVHTAKAITVNPLPTAQISGTPTICVGGSAPLSVTFTGTAPYTFTYAINGVSQAPVNTSANPYTITATVNGTYTVVNVTDATTCTGIGVGSAVVSYFPQPTGIISGTAQNCKGIPSTITMTFTGTAPYTFTYTDGVTPVTVTNHPTNVYTINVTPLTTTTYTLTSLTDFNTCTGIVSGSAIITVNLPPVPALVGTNLTCNGDNSGAITTTITDGTAPFGYAWTGPDGYTANVQNINGLKAGYYAVVVTDSKGCTGTANKTLTEPAKLIATSAVTSNYNGSQISCNGASDARITVTASGGTGALSYLLVEQPANVTGAASGIFTGVGPGTYTVKVTDASLCNVTTLPVTITQPTVVAGTAAVTSNYNGSPISCNGASDGIITVTASGGTGALAYVLNELPANVTGATTGLFTGLPPNAAYTVKVTDKNGCFINTAPVPITQPAAVTVASSVTSNYNGSPISCNGASDGVITATSAGGTGARTYQLVELPANTTGAASGIFTGLPAGTYTVRVTDLNSCTISAAPLTLNNPAAITASIAITSNYNGAKVSCNGASDGIITVTAAGGTGALTYVLNQLPANVTGASSGVFTGLPAGVYSVTVTDLNSCTKITSTVTINNPTAVTASAAVTSNYNGSQISCSGSSDGRITTTASGGTGALTYLLVEIPANVTGAASGVFTGVPAGTYTISVTDLNGCNKITTPVTITAPLPVTASMAVTSSYNGSHISCNGASDGTLTVTASGGTGVLKYALDQIPANVSGLNTGIFTNIPAGTYTVTVTDKNNCTVVTAPVNVVAPAAVTATAAVTSNYNGAKISCFGASDAIITVTASGGTGPLAYSLVEQPGNTTGVATGIFTGVGPGTYTVHVTDLNTCNVTTLPVTIANPAVITATGSVTSNYNGSHISCFGAADGRIAVVAAGGTGALSYVLNQDPLNVTGAATGIFTGLVAGTYTVTVTDLNGCSKTTANIVVNNPAAITASALVTSNYNGAQITCNGASDGRIAVTASGGTGALSYLLVEIPGNVTGAASGIFTGLPAGTYTVTVTDLNSCSKTTLPVTINNPVAVTASALVTSNYNGSELSCAGASDGRISVTASGGTGVLKYVLDQIPGNVTGQNTGIFTALPAGTYTVTVSDKNNCSVVTAAVTITAPAAVTASAAVTSNYNGAQLSCNGASDGRITVTAAGGTGTLTYSIIEIPGNLTGAASGIFTGIAAGTYTVRVTDLNNCSVVTPAVTIANPTAITATGSVTSNYNGSHVSCNGAADGRITIVASGGTGALAYVLNQDPLNVTGAASGIFTGLVAGTYTVTVTDLNSCTKTTSSITVNNPAALLASAAVTSNYNGSQISCNGASDGRLTVTSSGGTGALTYVLQEIPANVTGAASGIFTGLPAGSYTVKVTDLNGCNVTTAAKTITAPAVVTATTAITSNYNGSHVSCNGASDGRITVTASGGTGSLTYVLNELPANITGSITGVFTGLPAGSYTVKVTDLNSCFVNTAAVVLVNPTAVTALAAITSNFNGAHVSCNGASDGRITVTASGGTGALSYVVQEQPGNTTGAATGIFTGLHAGSYTVKVSDLNGCNVITPALVLVNPPAITAPIAVTSNYNGAKISCNGASDGIITVTGGGGTGALTYVLDQNPANVTGVASGIFTGLAAGTYSVTVTDANGCTKTTLSVSLSDPPAVNATAAVTSNYNGSPISCSGASDGRITVSASGGTGALSYLLVEIPGNVTGAATGIFTGVPAGTYTIRVRDLNLCTVITVPVTITDPLPVTATAAVTSNYNGSQLSCNTSTDGRITVTASGGTGALKYVLNELPANVSGLNTGIFTNVPAGTYTINVTDKNNCLAVTAAVTITAPVAITASASVTSNYNGAQVSCNGSSDGVITAAAAGGTGALTYAVVQMPGNLTGVASGIFTGMPAGTYTIRVTDLNNCSFVTPSVTITNPAVITATGAVTSNYNGSQVSCTGASDGRITITAAGGTGALSYVLDQIPGNVTGAASGIFTGLPAGTYTVTVKDLNNCTKTTTSITISNPPALSASATVTSNYNGSQISCNGASDGRIAVTASGGTGAKAYLLVELPGNVTGAASGIFTGLPAGTYTVTVTDLNGCNITTLPVTVSNPPALAATAAVTSNYFGSQLSCNGASDGRITVSASGGTGALGYQLIEIPGNVTGALTGTFTGLPAGTYTFRVTDQNACTMVTAPVTITPPPALTLTVSVTSNYNGMNISCNGATDGQATAAAAGGTGSLSYIWYSNPAMTIPIGQITSVAINLGAGTYYVKVTDSNGCSTSGSVTLTAPTAITATVTTVAVDCYGAATGSITVSGTAGGTGPYLYSIDGGGTWQAGTAFNALPAANYTLLVKDANNCIKSIAAAITQPLQLVANITTLTNVSCFGGNNGAVTITVTAGTGTAPYQYSKDGGTTWQGANNFTGLIAGAYSVVVKDSKNCSVTIPVVVTEPAILQLTATPNIVLPCFNDMTGSGTFTASGGTLPYTFTVITNNTGGTVPAAGPTTQAFFGAGAGDITVKVTDAKGCTVQATIFVTQPAILTPGSIGASQVICNGSNPAMLTQLTPPTGGPGAYNYQWQYSTSAVGPFINIPTATLSTYTPPANATSTFYYQRMVTSGSCTPVYSNVVEVLVNPKPVGILTGGETICPGATSKLKVNLPIGTGPYELDIQNYPGLTITGYVSDADINVTPAVTTTYKLLRIKDANGCEVLFPSANLIGSATVTVRALPAITVSPINKITCEFGMVTYSVTATGSDLTYQWYVNPGTGFVPVTDGGVYFGANSSSLMLFGTTRDMNGYIYRADVTGCATTVPSATATLTVNTPPEITSQPRDSTICSTQGATFSVAATGTSLVYEWQVKKGALPFTPVVNDANFSGAALSTLTVTNAPGSFNNYIFRVKLTGTCGVPVYTNFVVLRVNVPPAVTLSPVSQPVCENGGPVYFTGNGSGLIDSLRWQVNTGSGWNDIYDGAIYSGTTSQQLALINVPVTYNTYQYRLALKAFCATSYTNAATLTVNANPVVTFTPDPVNACGGVGKVLTPIITSGSGTWSQHTWTGDIGPLNNYFIQTPTFTSMIANTYNLTYKVKDNKGCSGTGTVAVIVDAPDATYSTDVNYGCTPLTVTFTKSMAGISKFWWNFGDGSPKDSVNANPVHIFTNVTPSSIEYYDVQLKVMSAGGCFATFTSTITVYPQIDATFTPSTLVVCSGKAITFTGLSGANKYFWDYDDGVSGYSSNVATHLFTNLTAAPVVRAVKLTTTSFYNCTNTTTVNITVMPVPLPQFTAAPLTQVFNVAGNPVTFTNTTPNLATFTYQWKFGDAGTSASTSPVHTYTGIGVFPVTLIASNANCTDSVKHSISVIPIPPVANFDSVLSACAPLYVAINNTSLNVATPGITYTWDFGDGSPVSHVKNPTYTYFNPGTYRITLTVFDAYGNTYVKSQVVDAYQSPKAYFEVTPVTVYVNDENVRCFNLSQNADYYVWEFGDGDTSKLKDPFHKYMTEGVYDITLHAYSVNGCKDSWTLSPGVTVEPPGVIRFSTVFTPNKEGPIDRTTLPTGGTEIDQFFFPPIRETVLNYKLQIFNRWGTLIFESHDINVPWNGYYKGKLCKQGVYVWYVEGKYANGKPFKKTGDVTLLH